MDLLDFGLYPSYPGTPKKDKELVSDGQGFYAGSGNDRLTANSTRVEDDSFPGGYATIPVVMSGGLGNDVYKFEKKSEWAFIADSGGGDDIIKFKKKFNPNNPTSTSRIDLILINDRDVLIIETRPNGGRSNGIAISDPFGKHPQFGDQNKIENVKFGKFGDEIMSFKKFYKKLKKLSTKNETKDNYGFQEATYTELNALGVLPLDGITDPSQLESGEYLGIGEYNNNLVDTANI